MKVLRSLAFLEGISLLLLLFIAMPLKYGFDWPLGVQVIGMAHGVLFIAYAVVLAAVAIKTKWSLKLTVLCFIAAFVPFGTFYVDKRYWRH